MFSTPFDLYEKTVLKHPRIALAMILALSVFLTFQVRYFKLDASSDSLILKGDPDLRYYQEIKRAYGSDDYLILTYTPAKDLFSEGSLNHLKKLVEDLEALPFVASVNSILSVPLFESPKVPLIMLATGFKTLTMDGVDVTLARKELLESPIYNNFLISTDGTTCGIQLNLRVDETFETLARRRQDLSNKKSDHAGLEEEEARELGSVERSYYLASARLSSQRRQEVAQVRAVMDQHRREAQLYLGGVPMIVADMIAFVESDILVFGLGIFLFLILVLAVIFRRPKWVILPLSTCFLTGISMIGLLGWLDWRATVISSNFTSLLLIITMSMAIHLVVRYRELHANNPKMEHSQLVSRATRSVITPCFYCALTTMVGFGSLVVSDIPPVKSFGLMMTTGIGMAFVLCFVFLPAALMLVPKGKAPRQTANRDSLMAFFARFTERRGGFILAASLVFILIGGWGITKLTVENKFIDYFKGSTEIYRGMKIIDESLGGTTPLEIILDGPKKDYWFQKENLARLRQIDAYLDDLGPTGKVLSLDTMIRSVEKVNDGKPLNRFMLNLVRKFLPADMKASVLKPYVNKNYDQVRITARIQETGQTLDRGALLAQIRGYLEQDMGIAAESIHLTGMYVLYHNMLQSLFTSQILTIGMVFAATWLMFLILFRSFALASIALIPNVFPVVFVLGFLGLLGIPLDMMTITIAAITIGIAVDHTIHYIHRFKQEFPQDRHYLNTMIRCHGSIGKAMYYTSITIIAGFSILALSNFIPTVYFGLFTGLAMTVALLAALTLLPRLIILLKPLGPEGPT